MTIPKTIATTDMPWMEIAPARRVCMGRRRPLEKPLQPIAEEHSLSNGELMALLFLRLVASKQRAIMKDLHRLSELAFRYQSMEPDIVALEALDSKQQVLEKCRALSLGTGEIKLITMLWRLQNGAYGDG